MNARLLLTHTLSPLHAGTGQGVGAIDLPTAREKSTQIPYLPGSSVKGVLRDACQDTALRTVVFGPDTAHASDHAGAVHFTDQRLLLMPVRSVRGTFAWVTSPFVLHRFLRDVALTTVTLFPQDVPAPDEMERCLVTSDSALLDEQNQVVLEDIPLRAGEEPVDAWATALGQALFPDDNAWQAILSARFCLVHDEVFGFLVDQATEVVARIALDDAKKTVRRGALWYEEALPAESVLSGLVVAAPVQGVDAQQVFETVAGLLTGPLQIGGSATTGRGLCRMYLLPQGGAA